MCVQATMLAEHVIEHVAARLGLDPVSVRERNFLQLPGQLLYHKWTHCKQFFCEPQLSCTVSCISAI
jgi:xanthine dehydrogenase molybdopterin-binding subunit B